MYTIDITATLSSLSSVVLLSSHANGDDHKPTCWRTYGASGRIARKRGLSQALTMTTPAVVSARIARQTGMSQALTMTTLCCRLGTHRTPKLTTLCSTDCCLCLPSQCLENRFGRRTIVQSRFLVKWRHVQMLRRECRPSSVRAGFLPRQRLPYQARYASLAGESDSCIYYRRDAGPSYATTVHIWVYTSSMR